MRRLCCILVAVAVLSTPGCATMKEFARDHGPDILRDLGKSVIGEVREEVGERDLEGWGLAVRLGLDLLMRWVSTVPREG